MISGKVLSNILYCLVKQGYKTKDTFLEVEELCKLPSHYLLGLIVYMERKVRKKIQNKIMNSFITNKNKVNEDFIDIEKLIRNLKVNKLVQSIPVIINREPKNTKEFYSFKAKGPLAITDPDPELKVKCQLGLHILKYYKLFETYSKADELDNIKPMLEVLELLKPIFNRVISKSVKKLRRTKLEAGKYSFINYGIPIKALGTRNSNTINSHTNIKFTKSCSTLLKSDCRKINISKKCEPINVFTNDTSFDPNFIFSSQKSVASLTKAKDWSVLGANQRYITYKHRYTLY